MVGAGAPDPRVAEFLCAIDDGEPDEVAAAKKMIVRTEERIGLKPSYLAADTAYGTGKFLAWTIGQSITPHITVKDQSERTDGTFSRSDFKFDKERNVYVCPAGKLLKTTGRILSDNTLRYYASTYDCRSCPLKANCCPKSPQRKIPRDINEDARDHARGRAGSPEPGSAA